MANAVHDLYAQTPPPGEGARIDRPAGRVLVLEDNDAMLQIIGMQLRREGLDIRLAVDGRRALDAIYEHLPDLIISDINMPGLDGFALCRAVRTERAFAQIPFIFVSCRDSIEERLEGFKLGADDFLVKPFDVRELVARTRIQLLRLQTLRTEARTDFLTSLPNRRAIDERLEGEVSRSARFGKTFSVAIIDLDHFKRVNDTHGHSAGDEVLREVGGRLAAAARDIDVVGRFGGEEFLVVMPETPADGAALALERMREAVERTPCVAEGMALPITMSAGFASYPFHGGGTEELVRHADRALYDAKRAGRNQVCGYRDPGC